MLSLLIGATVYTFSLILAVFLFGIGIGSSIGSAMARSVARPRLALGWCQMLLCGAMFWAAYMCTQSLPWWPINPSLATSPWFNFQLDLVRDDVGGAAGGDSVGRELPARAGVGRAGGAGSGAAGRRRLRRQHRRRDHRRDDLEPAARHLARQPALAAAADHHRRPLGPARARSGAVAPRTASGVRSSPARLPIIVAAVCAALLARNVPSIPPLLVAYGRYAVTRIGQADIIYWGEGWNASVAVSRLPGGVLNYHNAGKVQASSEPQDMRLQRMLGHMTTLIPDEPQARCW